MEHEQAVKNLAVESYLLGEMTSEEREAFEQHYFECPICADDVRSASQFIGEMKQVLEAGQPPSPAARIPASRAWASGGWRGWFRPQVAAAAIAVLAVVAGFEGLSVIPRLRQQLESASSPRLVTAYVLHPQTRGTPSIVNVAAGAPAILTLDLPEFAPSSAASGLRFLVKSSDGRTVLEIRGEPVSPGEPVTLSIPKLDLPAGEYALAVETMPGKNQAGQELARYPFELKHQN